MIGRPMYEDTEESISEYEKQLQYVEISLMTCNEDQKAELLELRSNLLEVLNLTQETALSAQSSLCDTNSKEENNTNIENQLDAEFIRFQDEIRELCSSNGNISETCNPGNKATDMPLTSDIKELLSNELTELSSRLEGSKCKAPFSHDWGEKDYYNAIILSLEVDCINLSSLDDLMVKVLFCNPTCEAMKPCPYFMEGWCKFSEDKCRFSHGHIVKLSEIEEFLIPDYSTFQRDSLCLAKSSDDLWHRATVEKCLDDHKYLIKYTQINDTALLDIGDILPIDNYYSGNEDELRNESTRVLHSLSPSSKNLESITAQYPIDLSCRQFGEWEKHTKGFGSKLMAKMGYIWGQGLGKNGEGRTEPLEAVILPAGKSLDKCIEIREATGDKDHFSVNKRLKTIKKKDENISCKTYKKTVCKKSIFDFINGVVDKKGNIMETTILSKKQSKHSEILKFTDKSLNIKSFEINENIKKVQKELKHLHEALNRNIDRSDKILKHQLEERILIQQKKIRSLKQQEMMINKEQKVRIDNNKLTIF